MQKVCRYIKENKLASILGIMIILFVIIQLVEVHFFNIDQYSDFKNYLKLATNVINTGNIYPSYAERHADSIVAPGYVNFLALLLLIFKNNVRHVLYFNIILNLILLFEVYFLTSKLSNKTVARIAIVLFCLYLTNYSIILFTGTDLIFVVLAYGALCLFFKDDYKYYLISGIILALANWIRSLMLPFIFIMVLFFIFKRKNYKKLITFFIGIIITCSTIGTITYKNFGYFSFQSVTTGANLIMGANDAATGKFNDTPLIPGGVGYAIRSNTKITVMERNKRLTDMSVAWIKKHPTKYIGLIPTKLYYMYHEDYTFVYKFANNDYRFIYRALFSNRLLFGIFVKILTLITHQGNFIYYAFLMIMSLVGTILALLKKEYNLLIFSGIIICITGLTIVLYGNDRYHYPCMVSVIALASYGIFSLYKRHTIKN